MKVNLTKAQIRAYKRSKGTICPRCKSKNIEAIERPDPDGPLAYGGVMCHDCSLRWSDEWKFNGLDPDNISDNTPKPEETENA